MVLILLRHALPSGILLKALIDGHILLKEGEPIVTLRERTGNDSLLTPASHLSVTRIIFLIPRLVVHASEFLAGLYSVRFFGQEQPTLQIIEAEALESQLASAPRRTSSMNLFLSPKNLAFTCSAPTLSRKVLMAPSAVKDG